MGRSRTAGWSQPGWRQAGKVPSAGAAASAVVPTPQIWDANQFSFPGVVEAAANLGFAGFTAPADTDYLVPMAFGAAGTIIALQYIQAQVGRCVLAVYTTTPGSPRFPTGRKFSTEINGGTFHTVNTLTGLSIAIAANELCWFLLSFPAANPAGSDLVFSSNAYFNYCGTSLSGVAGSAIICLQTIAHARAYTNPPPDPYPAITGADFCCGPSQQGVFQGPRSMPIFAIKFAPT